MKKEKRDFLYEVILRVALEENRKLNFDEIYHGLLLYHAELIEATEEFKNELKKIIEDVNKIPHEKKSKMVSKKDSKLDLNLLKKPKAEIYVNTFKEKRKVINLSTKLSPSGKKMIKMEFVPNSPILDGKKIYSSYYELLKDKRLGEDEELLRGIYNHRKELIQYRGSYDVTLYDERGMASAQFKVISCLIEHGQEIVNFFHGITIDMSGEDGFTKYLRAFHYKYMQLGIKQVIPTLYPSSKIKVSEVKTDYSFA